MGRRGSFPFLFFFFSFPFKYNSVQQTCLICPRQFVRCRCPPLLLFPMPANSDLQARRVGFSMFRCMRGFFAQGVGCVSRGRASRWLVLLRLLLLVEVINW